MTSFKHKSLKQIVLLLLATPYLFNHLQFAAYAVEALQGVAAGDDNLVAVDEAGHYEIEESLKPEQTVLKDDIAEGGTHRVHADVCPYAEGGGEEP